MEIAPFDVVIVPFPYSDRLAEKRRPAIVVSSGALHAEAEIVWVAMVTTTPPRSMHDFRLVDLSPTGLAVSCGVRPAKLAAIESSRILRRIGALGHHDRAQMATTLDRLAGWRDEPMITPP